VLKYSVVPGPPDATDSLRNPQKSGDIFLRLADFFNNQLTITFVNGEVKHQLKMSGIHLRRIFWKVDFLLTALRVPLKRFLNVVPFSCEFVPSLCEFLANMRFFAI